MADFRFILAILLATLPRFTSSRQSDFDNCGGDFTENMFIFGDREWRDASNRLVTNQNHSSLVDTMRYDRGYPIYWRCNKYGAQNIKKNSAIVLGRSVRELRLHDVYSFIYILLQFINHPSLNDFVSNWIASLGHPMWLRFIFSRLTLSNLHFQLELTIFNWQLQISCPSNAVDKRS